MEKIITPVDINTRKKLDMRSGDTVRVWQKIEERGKTRLQAFEGMILARKHGTEAGATFTVRRNTGGFGVEKIFPLYSPMIDKIEILKRSKTRRSKLYYVRDKALKEISKRFKMMFMTHSTDDLKEVAPDAVQEPEVSEDAIPVSEDITPVSEDITPVSEDVIPAEAGTQALEDIKEETSNEEVSEAEEETLATEESKEDTKQDSK